MSASAGGPRTPERVVGRASTHAERSRDRIALFGANVARAQTRQGFAERNGEIISLIVGNQNLPRHGRCGGSQKWRQTPPNCLRGLLSSPGWAMFGLVRHVENVYLQVVEGVVDESVLNSHGFRDNPHFSTPQFAEYGRSELKGFA